MDIIKRAMAVAIEQHGEQKRMISNAPYIDHILEVAKLLLYELASEEVIAAGILHDTIEDTTYTKEELLQDFGEKITSLVIFCTEPDNDETKTGEELRKSWKRRKQHTIDACQHASSDELMLTMADKLANLSSLREDLAVYGTTIWNHFDSTTKEQEWYYRSLGDIFSKKLPQSRMHNIYLDCLEDVFPTQKENEEKEAETNKDNIRKSPEIKPAS